MTKMKHHVPNYELDDEYSVPPSSTLTRKSSMAANEVMELLWLNGSITPHHSAPVPPSAASGMQSAVEEAADEMASWLHYPLHDANFEPDISEYFNPPPPPSPATAPPLPSPPRRFMNFVHCTAGEGTRKEIRASSSGKAAAAAKESTVVESNETPKVTQVGSSEVPKVESGGMSLHEGGGTSTSARDSTTTINSDDFTSSPGDSGASMTAGVELTQPTLAIGMIREEDNEAVKGGDRKQKGGGADENEGQSLDTEFESGKGKKQERASTSTKRSRAVEVHNLSERKRRDRINEKMKSLQEIVPCFNKTDKASMLDDAIEYLKALQSQVQMMSMGYGMVPIPYSGVQQYMHAMGMSMNHPLVPYPQVPQGSTMPVPAAGVPMHMPVVHDQSRMQASNPVDPAMISMPPHNPHPNFTNPYLQYLGLQHCQVLIPQQNQAAMEHNKAKLSTSREDGKC